jgi:hypothetical protein
MTPEPHAVMLLQRRLWQPGSSPARRVYITSGGVGSKLPIRFLFDNAGAPAGIVRHDARVDLSAFSSD